MHDSYLIYEYSFFSSSITYFSIVECSTLTVKIFNFQIIDQGSIQLSILIYSVNHHKDKRKWQNDEINKLTVNDGLINLRDFEAK